MKNLKDVLLTHPDQKALINAVINNIGITSINDVLNLGPAAGFSGFIYGHDTSKFYRRYRKTISSWLKERAAAYRVEPADMILSFPGLTHYPEITTDNINFCLLYNSLPHDAFIPVEHIISLVTLHEVCKLFMDEKRPAL